MLDSAGKRILRRRLLDWYGRHARALPWRRTRDPYPVWVSEIMLQQTQVATVIPYFDRFLARFPSVTSLADAPEEEVLRLWEGLGYYRRARQLHRAAQQIRDRFHGEFPCELSEALSLPGIGRYTAGAILSIAHDARLPILEANTVRLFSRLLASEDDPTSRAGQARLWQFAEEILPMRNVGRFNQALMELGSQVCRPRDPLCVECPLQSICPTFAAGRQNEIPANRKVVNYESAHEACVVIWRRRRVLLRYCRDEERWAGLWDFPRFSVDPRAAVPRQLVTAAAQLCGVAIEPGERLTTIKHGVTRFRITLDCYLATWQRGGVSGTGMKWVKPSELGQVPLTRTARQVSTLLADSAVSETGNR